MLIITNRIWLKQCKTSFSLIVNNVDQYNIFSKHHTIVTLKLLVTSQNIPLFSEVKSINLKTMTLQNTLKTFYHFHPSFFFVCNQRTINIAKHQRRASSPYSRGQRSKMSCSSCQCIKDHLIVGSTNFINSHDYETCS